TIVVTSACRCDYRRKSGRTRLKSHKVVKLEVITTYQALADFSRDLVAAVRGTATDAVLRGEMLP
ncbi:MAG: hypothetical protein WCC95_14760, partial [Candidatus Sulfotelmatobacter sp.]